MEKQKIDWNGRIRKLILEAIASRSPQKFASTRAIYYYLGGKNEIPLTERGYKALNALTVDMRQKGEIPWGYFPVIRGANGVSASRWIDPEDFFDNHKNWFINSADYYKLPRWLNQSYHVEVWVEKLGLLPDAEHAVEGLDIQCRALGGFPPWEFVHDNLQAIKSYLEERREEAQFVVLYLGDLDPSGRDIARQLVEALEFFNLDVQLEWVGILPEHVIKYNLPEIPLDQEVIAKIHRDSRYKKYMEWLSEEGVEGEMFAELDAWNGVAPNAIKDELRPKVEEYFDQDDLAEATSEYEENKQKLEEMLEDAKRKLDME
ncbi:MAG: toprim domain-containing protein [Thermoplasmataceae archaeon]